MPTISKNQCRVNHAGNSLSFQSPVIPEDRLQVDVCSNGQTVICVREGSDVAAVVLTNRAAHELRDFLNRRFPNSTEVQ